MLKVKIPLLVVLAAVACAGSQGVRTPASESPGPALLVERFLRAANANDLDTMTQLFGSRDRTIVQLEGRTQGEQRMYVLASLLRHDDWALQGQRTVPGELLDATDLLVELRQGPRSTVVPFKVVRRKDGGWIIERIDVTPLTSDARRPR
jgi:hypothetical protein